MTLTTTRITVTLREHELLSPGLEILANGLVSAKLNAFPHRHAWDRVDTSLSNIHRYRAYDEPMAQRIFSTRAKVLGMTATRKVRLDVFQIAVAALALRLGRPKTGIHAIAPSSEMIRAYDALVRKLEKYRKRARRAAITDFGATEFARAAERWRNFNQWVRYYLLQFTVKKVPRSAYRLNARDQRKALTLMIQLAIQERCHAPLCEQVLDKMVTLAKASFLRGRQPMTLKELLSSGQKGRELLFAFVTTRVETTPLPGAAIPSWRASMERAEKCQAYIDSKATIGQRRTSCSVGGSGTIT